MKTIGLLALLLGAPALAAPEPKTIAAAEPKAVATAQPTRHALSSGTSLRITTQLGRGTTVRVAKAANPQ